MAAGLPGAVISKLEANKRRASEITPSTHPTFSVAAVRRAEHRRHAEHRVRLLDLRLLVPEGAVEARAAVRDRRPLVATA